MRRKLLGEAYMSEEMSTTLGAVGIHDLMKLLPHRYPFLLIDRIIDIDADNSAIGIKNVTANEPHFAGHFPERPVMPGVLIVEAMCQTAGAICARKQVGVGHLVYLMTIDKARFRKPVEPGDRLEIHVCKRHRRHNVWKFHCEAKVDGAVVAEADVCAMLVIEENEYI
jgi:3-hydroxyacyl-[acyl-carrier-protein] dehydratase